MKKSFLFFTFSIFIVLLATSCGGAKKTLKPVEDSNDQSALVRAWVEDAPRGVLRGFGQGSAPSFMVEQKAYDEAANNARAGIARAISFKFQEVKTDWEKEYFEGSMSSTESGTNEELKQNREGESVSEVAAVVAGAIVKISHKTTLPSGAITYYVGVETDAEKVVQYLSASSSVRELISKQNKLEMDQAKSDFEEKFRDKLFGKAAH